MNLFKQLGSIASVMFLTIDMTCWSFQHLLVVPYVSRLGQERSSQLFASNQNDDESTSGTDWRDVRAKLVMQYSHSEDNFLKGGNSTSTSMKQPTSTTTTDRWAYDSKCTIEVGSLIVSHPSQDFACGGLRQQYFHKCIVLVIDHSREGTKGIILNRPTNQALNGKEQTGWKCYFGGNTGGIGSEDESLGCLYRLNELSSVKNGMALTILKDIGIMPWEIAKVLVDEKEATKEDFRLYRGYTKWGPGKLEMELERGDWFTMATDTKTLWEDIIAPDPSFSTGTDKWVQVMNRIGKKSLLSSIPNQKFQDDMLKQYMRLRIMNDSQSNPVRSISQKQRDQRVDEDNQNLVPGTLVRSCAPILLDEQVFHQSLVLILSSTQETTVGVVLNRPQSNSVSIDGTTLPVRYGGRFELDDEGIPELCIHYNHQALQEANIGEPISKNGKAESIFWKCTREDVKSVVKVGLANADDFLIVSGLSVWNKKDTPRQREGPSSMRLDDCFSKVDESSIGTIWELLKCQEPLNKKNAVENLEAANTAWMLSGDAGWMLSGSSKQFDSRTLSDMDSKEQQVVQSLAYSALDKWIRMYLLKP